MCDSVHFVHTGRRCVSRHLKTRLREREGKCKLVLPPVVFIDSVTSSFPAVLFAYPFSTPLPSFPPPSPSYPPTPFLPFFPPSPLSPSLLLPSLSPSPLLHFSPSCSTDLVYPFSLRHIALDREHLEKREQLLQVPMQCAHVT